MRQLILPDNYRKEMEGWKKDCPFVFIGITTYKGELNYRLSNILMLWMARAMSKKTFKFTTAVCANHTPLDSARNSLVRKFFNEYPESTHFCLIDDDIMPFDNTLETLLDLDLDIVSPLIFTIKHDEEEVACPAPLVFRRGENGLELKCDLEGVVETDSIPGGFFVAKKKLMEDIRKPAFKYDYDADGVKTRGTDEYFTDRIIEAGYKMHVHSDLIVEQGLRIGGASFNMAMIRMADKLSKMGVGSA